ncbi:MAG TPA: heme biosynthesis HemY N-terminal domain-containing protein [Alphaproteobacteria bacterium]|nr:heme biosynthesis HemY N-terminal domain-containing protein [Alphaproteobacteria bacterium]
MMIRATFYLVLAIVLAACVAWLADHPGSVTLHWGELRIDTSVAVLAAGIAVIAAAAALFYQLWRWLARAPRAFARSRREHRRLKGYHALTQGMVAVAAGDATEARRQARRADVLLNEPPLTMLLSAQAAQLNGDEAAAERYFRAMLERRETEFLGLRGLIMQATKKGDTAGALALARRAKLLRPKTEWVLATLYELEARAGDWRSAGETARLAVRQGTMTAEEGVRNRAIALYEESLAAAATGNAESALRAARKSLALDPAFTPAALAAAKLQGESGKRRRAERVIERAWERLPHPALAAQYLSLGGEAEPLKRMMRMQRLAALRPAHPESRLALAEAAIAARLWGEARRALEELSRAEGSRESARACRLWAALEEAEHGDGALARAWLSRAARAEPEPQWVCARCGAAHGEWAPFCRGCAAYGALAWRSPSHAAAPALERVEALGKAVNAAPPAKSSFLANDAPRPAEAVTDAGV